MPDIKMLSWNIEVYGPKKANINANASDLVDYIARLIYKEDPAIVSFLELNRNWTSTIVDKITKKYTSIYNSGKSSSNKISNPWYKYVGDAHGNNEGYAVMFRLGCGFLPVDKKGKTVIGATLKKALYGSTNRGDKDSSGKKIPFPTEWSKSGGRIPFYVIFKTTDKTPSSNNVYFSVLAFHNLSPGKTNTPYGISAISKIFPIEYTGGNPNKTLTASLISGDFNIDIESDVDAYYPLTNLPSWYAIYAKTSLKVKAPWDEYNAYAYRANAYDNVFQKVQSILYSNAGDVLDLIKDSASIPGIPNDDVGRMYKYVGSFWPSAFKREVCRKNVIFPPRTYLDSWKFVLGALSDHLPITTSTTIK